MERIREYRSGENIIKEKDRDDNERIDRKRQKDRIEKRDRIER